MHSCAFLQFNDNGQNVAIGAAHLETAAIAFPGGINGYVRIAVTSAAHIRIGAAPVAVATDTLVQPNVEYIFPCPNNGKVSVIQDAAAGTMNVTSFFAKAKATNPGDYVPGLTND